MRIEMDKGLEKILWKKEKLNRILTSTSSWGKGGRKGGMSLDPCRQKAQLRAGL